MYMHMQQFYFLYEQIFILFQLVHEFLEETSYGSPQPFRMDTLLAEMRELESRAGPVRSAPVSQLATEGDVQEWAQQYIDSGKHFQVHP